MDMFTANVPPHGVFAGRLIPVESSPDHLNWRPWHGRYSDVKAY
jgi:hypothetical protein